MTISAEEFSASGVTTPAAFGVEITPADADLEEYTRAIYVGSTGNLEVIMAGDEHVITLIGVLAGSLLPLRVKQIRAGTTATNIVALR